MNSMKGTKWSKDNWPSSPPVSFGFLNIKKALNMIRSYQKVCLKRSEGEKIMSPPNVPLWHAGCFELQSIKTQQTQEKFPVSALTAQNNVDQATYARKRVIYQGQLFISERLTCLEQQMFASQALALPILLWVVFLPFEASDP